MTRTALTARLAVCVLLLSPSIVAAQQVAVRQFTAADGLGHNVVTDVFEDSRGFLWFATAAGLTRFDGLRFITFNSANGVPAGALTAIGETDGALWVASRGRGVMHVVDRPDRPRSLARTENVTSGTATTVMSPVTRVPLSLSAIKHRLFETRDNENAPLLIRDTRSAVMDVTQDRQGNVWIVTSGSGVFVVPAEPLVGYTAADELPDENVLRVVESLDGRVYAITRRGGVAQLRDDGVEPVPGSLFAPFHTIGRRIRQDEHGAWWFWTNAGAFTAPGPALSFTKARPSPDVRPEPADDAPFIDSRGWTWTALRGGGVSVCKPQPSRAPACVDYTKSEGVSHGVTSLTEDAFGRVYVGTRKGLLRFDARDGDFGTILSDRALTRVSVTDCMRDSRGRIWIATTSGAFFLIPRPPQTPQTPQVYVTSLLAGDEEIAAPLRGAVALQTLHLDAHRHTVRIEYAAPGSDGRVVYQHRLAGLNDEWSATTAERAVTYSRLRPGSYRFEVRSISSTGVTGMPATVGIEFRGNAWARWWWPAAGAAVLLLACSLRQAQRSHRRRDLTGVSLRVFGGMEQQSKHGGGDGSASNGSRLAQR